MKKSNTTKKLCDRTQGNFAMIHNTVLQNGKLSPNAKILLIHFLNNADDWENFLWYYSNRYGWNRNHQASITRELKDNGFLKVEKKSNGKGKPFTYVYYVSELGDIVQEEKKEKTIAKQTPPARSEPAADVQREQIFIPDAAQIEEAFRRVNVKGNEAARRKIFDTLLDQLMSRMSNGKDVFRNIEHFQERIEDLYVGVSTPLLI